MPGGSILITRAPKSDMIVAAAGPAMKLAQSITRRSENSDDVMRGLRAEYAATLASRLAAPQAQARTLTRGPEAYGASPESGFFEPFFSSVISSCRSLRSDGSLPVVMSWIRQAPFSLTRSKLECRVPSLG